MFRGYRRLWPKTSGHDVRYYLAAAVSRSFLSTLDLFFANPGVPLPLSVRAHRQRGCHDWFCGIRYRSRCHADEMALGRAIWPHGISRTHTRVLIVGAGISGQTTAWRLKYRAPDSSHRCRTSLALWSDRSAEAGHVYRGLRGPGNPMLTSRTGRMHRVELIVVAIHNIDGRVPPDLGYCENRPPCGSRTRPRMFLGDLQHRSCPTSAGCAGRRLLAADGRVA